MSDDEVVFVNHVARLNKEYRNSAILSLIDVDYLSYLRGQVGALYGPPEDAEYLVTDKHDDLELCRNASKPQG